MEQIKPKGTRDFIPEECSKIKLIEEVIKREADTHCYKEIRTPMFEHTEVFARSNGETSDIVNKEMYTFTDRGNRSISLRPEGTAGTIRCFVENKLYANADLPVKLYYLGPNFRYERPQAGRYRQFSQFGVENIGVKSPYLDADTILFAVDIISALGIKDFKVKINSIGDAQSRAKYCEALKDYFKPYINELCEDCKERIEKNPLRILDCKVDNNHPCMKGYPSIEDYLSEESRDYFGQVIRILNDYNVPFEIDNKLVRGLDYYNDVVFEIYAKTPSGTDYGAIIAGGRYDHLVEQFNGPSLPAFGFGLGVDRICEVCKDCGVFEGYGEAMTCYVMPMNEACLDYAMYVANYLRINGVDTDIDYQTRSLKSQFKTCDRKNVGFSIVIGEEEVQSQSVNVRFNKTKVQEVVGLRDLINYLNETLYNDENQHSCGCGCHDDGCDCGCDDDCECGCHEEGHECHCHDDGCECGCGCDDNCECGCHEEGHECHCHDEECECGCGCDDDCDCGCHEHDHECCCHDEHKVEHCECGCGATIVDGVCVDCKCKDGNICPDCKCKDGDYCCPDCKCGKHPHAKEEHKVEHCECGCGATIVDGVCVDCKCKDGNICPDCKCKDGDYCCPDCKCGKHPHTKEEHNVEYCECGCGATIVDGVCVDCKCKDGNVCPDCKCKDGDYCCPDCKCGKHPHSEEDQRKEKQHCCCEKN